MSHPIITFANAVMAIGVLPSLARRPRSNNIRVLVVNLIDKLTIIPSKQSADLGFWGYGRARQSLRAPNQQSLGGLAISRPNTDLK